MARTSSQVRLPVTRSRNGWHIGGHLRCLLISCPGVSLLSESRLFHVQNLHVYRGWPASGWWALLPHP